VDHAAADVDLEVDVRRAAAIPAGVDRQEARAAVGVGLLVAAQVPVGVGRRGVLAAGGAGGAALVARVDATGVAVPDLDVRALDRAARLGVLHGEHQLEREAGTVLGDVAARELVVDPVGALGDLGAEDARAGGLGALGAEHAGRARAEGAGEAEPGQGERLASAQETGVLVVHGRSIERRAQTRLSRA
jgi:hypothetical protein